MSHLQDVTLGSTEGRPTISPTPWAFHRVDPGEICILVELTV